MNLSGQPIGEVMRFYKLPLSALIIAHDELDVAPGKLKVKIGGSAGGHNGLKSIDQHVGQDYLRIRLGIGHPGHRDQVTPYVLSDFSKEDKPDADALIDAAAKHLPTLLNGDAARYMNDVALTLNQETP